ncbi:MAG: TonB-system energizer ExbB [Gammaproteobacteria bacterium]|nr:TonB-system energizer ExbB [Gammaproteobacteria bacterium]
MEWLKAWLDPLVFSTLGLMSVVMVAFTLERWVFFRKVQLSDYSHIKRLEVALSNHITPIYTIGSMAPYVGLLGTVIGILITFHDMGQTNNISASNIMVGLAMALKATALGLLVAIPAVMITNQLQRRMDVLMALWQAEQDERA